MNRIPCSASNKKQCFVLATAIACFFYLSLSNSHAEEKGRKRNQSNKEPITVKSDRMLSAQKENKIFFYGNVVAVRGDLTIHSDELEVYNGPEGSSPEKITATGNVVIDRNDRHATGQKAVYYDSTQRIILTGKPRAWEKNNEITGNEMIFLIEEDKFIVNSAKKEGGQIELKLYPEKKEDKKKSRTSKRPRTKRKR